jgi:hypothetical protein
MQNTEQTKPKDLLKAYRKLSDRHVLVLETTLTQEEKCKVYHYADLERKAGNELVAIMKKNYEQLLRTKKYRKLLALYGSYKKSKRKKECKEIANQMKEMQEQYHVTEDFCKTSMIPIGKKYGLKAVFALTKAEDVWSGIEKCLFSNGKTIHFAKRGDLPCLRAKQYDRTIVLSVNQNRLQFKFQGMKFGVLIKDQFQTEEVNAIVAYLSEPEIKDKQAAQLLEEEGICISTYRPCYATLVCKTIRNKLRVYIHLTVEGVAKPKYNRFGERKHKMTQGVIGCDIGTQTIAYTSDREVGLKNLAERDSSILSNERKERILYRAMDRSRRAKNPQNYNEDGTIKKGRKTWKYSKRYQRLKQKHMQLCRINAINRHLAINEDVNHLRSLGDTFITESKNAEKLKKKAKNTTVNKNGKINRKKRFGKSIQNRCPGYFQAQIKKKFETTNGIYKEVPNDYRASQYDHTSDQYVKKKLSERMFRLSDQTLVQRDWYSSYLLYCYDFKTKSIDKTKCKNRFDVQYQKEIELIDWIQKHRCKVLNSGIKIA